MMYLKLTLATAIVLSTVLLEAVIAVDDEFQPKNDSLKILSRRKRYLVFPEGSSLQLGKYKNNFIEKFNKV